MKIYQINYTSEEAALIYLIYAMPFLKRVVHLDNFCMIISMDTNFQTKVHFYVLNSLISFKL